MRYFYNLWQAILGKLDSQLVIDLIDKVAEANYKAGVADAEMLAIKRDLEFAKAGIAELKHQQKFGGQGAQKAASDALAISIIEDMERNPKKFLP